jgi:membrane protein implicated in regulation of membrane protease activity
MDAWIPWLIAGVILAVGEMHFSGFFLGPFALGAFGAAVASLVGLGFALTVGIFAVITVLTFLLLRPIARRHLRQPAELRTGTAALVGRSAMVLERIANDEGVGVVKIDGEVWTARAYEDDQVIPAGQRVQVVEIRGATALVSE